MKNRTTVSVSLLVFVVLLPTVVAADGGVPVERAWNAGYVGACLSRSGLSLSDDTPLAAVEVRPSSRASYGGGPDEKNPMLALLLSCIVPGWGEMYVGDTSRGGWFMASEVAIWAAYGTFQIQGSMREDDYREYAEIFAGTDAGADGGYLSDMGDYISSEGDNSYNQAIARDARSLFPGDREAQRAYIAENGYYGDLSWDWGSSEHFVEYQELRFAASKSDRNAFYMVGVAMLNRAISGIDSAWMARRHNAGEDGEPVARLSVVPQISGGEVGARATLVVPF
jgi:hypothetical protein